MLCPRWDPEPSRSPRALSDPNLESGTQSPKTPTTCVWGRPPRAARPAPAAPVGHTEEAIACSPGRRRLRGRRAESAPGTRGRRGASCSRSGSQTSSISRRSQAPDSHPGPGAGWGRGLPRPAPPRPWQSLKPESHSQGGGRLVAATQRALVCPPPALGLTGHRGQGGLLTPMIGSWE